MTAHTPEGPGDSTCGCSTGEIAIACTLDERQVEDRLARWAAALAGASGRQDIAGGVRVLFPAGTDPAPLASVAGAEIGCCRFFTFTIAIDHDGVVLDVTAPPEARALVDALVDAEP